MYPNRYPAGAESGKFAIILLQNSLECSYLTQRGLQQNTRNTINFENEPCLGDYFNLQVEHILHQRC